ncbi:MAG: DUF87 domain-containing protein, partial [Euryarchaeota archaeon]|nr:DUF87 domain-containing protein [Euryarchaeota archaeon]
MESVAASKAAHHPHHPKDFIGVVYGDVGSTALRCAVFEPVERNEYVQIRHETCGWVLGRVDDIERKTDLSLDRSLLLGNGEEVDIEEKVSAQISIIGYRDDRDLLQVPRIPFRAGEHVLRADEPLIRKVVGLKHDVKHGAYAGLLNGHNIQVFLDINAMAQKHVSVLAKTGGGKSYITGVLLEE